MSDVAPKSTAADRSTGGVADVARRVLGLAPGSPDPVSGLRLASAFLAPVAIGEVVDETLSGLFVGIGAFMVANADLGGAYPARARVQGVALVAVVGTILLGMACGGSDAVAVPVAVAIATAAGLAGALGRGAQMVGIFSIFGVVIGIGLAGTPADEPGSRAGELVAGGLYAMALSLAPWPFEPLRPARRALVRAWGAVAALWRAPGAARGAAASRALSAIGLARAALPPGVAEGLEASLQQCGESFEEAVARTRGLAHGSRAAEERAVRADRAAAELASRRVRGRRATSTAAAERPRETALARLRAQLTLRSALLRHAIRLGVAVAIGLLLVPFVDDSNGAWMVTGALIVMKPAFGVTLRTSWQRAAGTVVGAAAAGALAALTSEPWVLLAAAFLLTWLGESLIRLSFTLFAVCITPLSILLANVLVPGDWEIALQRTVDVSLGAAIGVAVSLLVLPLPLRDSVPVRLAAAIRAVGGFVDAVLGALRDGGGHGPALHAARSEAERKIGDLGVLVAQLADEPAAWRRGTGAAPEALGALRSAVDHTATLALPLRHGDSTGTRDDGGTDGRTRWIEELADAAEAAREPPPAPAHHPDPQLTGVDDDLHALSVAVGRLASRTARERAGG